MMRPSIVTFLAFAAVLAALIALAAFAAADDATTAAPPQASLTDDEIDRMNLKSLRAELKRRGVECGDCLEKEHFRARLREVKDTPVVAEAASQEESKPAAKKEKEPEFDLASLREHFRSQRNKNDEMKEKLRKAGVDTTNMKFANDDSAFMDALFADEKKGKGKPRKGGKKAADL